MKLNLGCGSQVVDGWITVDYALGARVMKVPFARRVNRKLKLFILDCDKYIYIYIRNPPRDFLGRTRRLVSCIALILSITSTERTVEGLLKSVIEYFVRTGSSE